MLACKAEQVRCESDSNQFLTGLEKLALIKQSYESRKDTPLGSALLLLRYGARLEIVNSNDNNKTALDYVTDVFVSRVIESYGKLSSTSCKPCIQAFFENFVVDDEI